MSELRKPHGTELDAKAADVTNSALSNFSLRTSTTDVPTNTELIGAEPYVIRGHHVRVFKYIVDGQPSDIVAGELTQVRKEELGMIDPIKAKHELSKPYYHTWDDKQPYALDVIGETPEEARISETDLTQTFETFRQLPDDAPVKLVSEQKDGICHSCVHGRHCSTRNPSQLVGSDPSYVGIVKDVAEKKGHGDKLELGSEEVSYSDSIIIEQLPTLTTTAGVLRDVLADDSVDQRLKQKHLERNLELASNLLRLNRARKK